MGDFADMPSLCSYDEGTRGAEGRRYVDDVKACVDAQERIFRPFKRNKRKKPKFWMLKGNHEYRIDRATSLDPKMYGALSYSDLQFDYFGWETIDYDGASPGILDLDGIAYAHYHISGQMAKPISGVRPAYTMIQKYGHSMTAGHSHLFDYYVRLNSIDKAMGLVCGVFQDYRAPFAGTANDMWWRGMVHKRNVKDGLYDLECVSLAALKQQFGAKK
jgi:hypothetical protein